MTGLSLTGVRCSIPSVEVVASPPQRESTPFPSEMELDSIESTSCWSTQSTHSLTGESTIAFSVNDLFCPSSVEVPVSSFLVKHR